ncbi:MAG TPA: hypothetical protein VIH35_03375 [Kiritimatiellia bacterium]
MKSLLATALLLATGSLSAFAVDAPAEPIKITDTEAVIIEKTIRGYVEVRKDKIELFDRKKGKTVSVRLDKIITTDPDCVKFPKPGFVAICCDCTEVLTDGEETKDGDKYVIWFLVERGSLPTASVADTFIKSVNGQQMYEWTQGADGLWAATLVPDAMPTEPVVP